MTPWKFLAYLVVNKINGKKYVGITSQKLTARWSGHVRSHRWSRKTSAIGMAIEKYGQDAFEVAEICRMQTMEDAHEIERKLVVQHNSYANDGHGYNLTRGGEGAVGWKMSLEAVESMRQKMTGKKQSPETIEKRASYHRGAKRSAEFCEKMRRRTVTDETRQKISESITTYYKKNPPSREKLEKMWSASRGRVRPQEERDRISMSHKGIPHSDERKKNISRAKLEASARRKLEAQNKPGNALMVLGCMGMGC